MFSFRLQKYKIKQHRKQFLPANRAKNRDVPNVSFGGAKLRALTAGKKQGRKKFQFAKLKKAKYCLLE
jgi:hypothetical protein